MSPDAHPPSLSLEALDRRTDRLALPRTGKATAAVREKEREPAETR
jgi:hypothetical protein